MTYDLRGEMDMIATHHSALYFGSYEEGDQKVYNQVNIQILFFVFNNVLIQYSIF